MSLVRSIKSSNSRSFKFSSVCFSALVVSGVAGMACAPPPANPPATEAPAAPAAAEATPAEETPAVATETATTPAPVIDDASGGRLYDKWYAEAKLDFKAGEKGGPDGNGTLKNAAGQVIADTGHGFRLKNMFGWDLRGHEGIYGPEYQNKKTVVAKNLLTDTRSVDEIKTWLSNGDENLPALSTVLSSDQINNLAAFIDKMRSGALPLPEQVWTLSKTAPKNYTLNAGGDAARGQGIYGKSCAGCHGKDGRKFAIDDKYSLGEYGRQKAYEAWIKILNGQPGTKMKRMIKFENAADGAQQVLDVLAALCDRTVFPAMDGQESTPDGDARCGSYLK